MSRIHKYKIYSHVTKEMNVPVTIQRLCYEDMNPELDPMNERYVTFLEWTGLIDKNGKEIYEGDICKYPFNDDYVIGEVIYFGAMFGIGGMGLNQMAVMAVEIISNIYENPELLNNK